MMNPQACTVRAEQQPINVASLDGARTVDEVCALLRISRGTVRNWERSGRLRVVRPGRKVLIPISSLDDLLRS
jgi:excisionase family DNA binding protein